MKITKKDLLTKHAETFSLMVEFYKGEIPSELQEALFLVRGLIIKYGQEEKKDI